MTKYNKDSLQRVKNNMHNDDYYLPKSLFDKKSYGTIRLETKMAYVAILDTLLKKPNFNKEGEAFLKVDNPAIIHTLEILTNKKIDKSKMQVYYQELVMARLITIDNKDVFLMDID